MTDKIQRNTPAVEPTVPVAAAEAVTPLPEPEELHPAEALEVAIVELLDGYGQPHVRGQYDQRLIAIARTQIELGFLALYRALAKAEAEGEAV
jgi:hypothetical protein